MQTFREEWKSRSTGWGKKANKSVGTREQCANEKECGKKM